MKDHLCQSEKARAGESRLKLENVTFARQGREIIRDISLDINLTRLGIIGRNGSGKSTLARLICGLVAPESGVLRLNGIDIAHDRRAALREVGILFQNPDHQIIFPTVLEEIAFGLTQLGQSKKQAEDGARLTLAHFNKAHWEKAYISTLSEGQKHLLCLMAISAMRPRLLVLDEPFAGLDIPTKAQLARYLCLYEGNIVHITHNPDDLSGYAQTLWLDEGRVKLFGTSQKVIKSYLAQMAKSGQEDDIAKLAD